MSSRLLDLHINGNTIYPPLGKSGRYFRGNIAEVFWSLLPDGRKDDFNPRVLRVYSDEFVGDVTWLVRKWNRENPIHGPREDPGYDD